MSALAERLASARRKVKDDPYDIDSWQVIIKDCQCRLPDDVREVWESLISIFPTSGRFWKLYIEHEMR